MEVMLRNIIWLHGSILNKDHVAIPKTELKTNVVEDVLHVVFGFAGAVAIIMVALGGLKYINSLGNAQNVAKAKDTILYAIIGLIVCILGYSIVTFVVNKAAG